jgi:hypothetical protein
LGYNQIHKNEDITMDIQDISEWIVSKFVNLINEIRYQLGLLDCMSCTLVGMMLLCVLGGVFVICLAIDTVWVGEAISYPAEVVDGHYKPDDRESSVSPVVGVGTNGQMVSGVAVSSSGSDEEFMIMVRDSRDGEVYAIEVTPTIYYNYAIGDTVRVYEAFGKIFGQVKHTVPK